MKVNIESFLRTLSRKGILAVLETVLYVEMHYGESRVHRFGRTVKRKRFTTPEDSGHNSVASETQMKRRSGDNVHTSYFYPSGFRY